LDAKIAPQGVVIARDFTHPPLERPLDHAKYAATISAALRKELGNTHCAAKTVMQWTGASERTVKYWFAGTKGPSGEHLAMLVHHSDILLTAFLALAGRPSLLGDDALSEARARVAELNHLLGSSGTER